ncbi:MAG: sulfotransferase family protein [Sphingopyxis sp.]|uniref:sulfotransferase family protein n=1 Tax=Sphingopyxis sp. TaxID=1908224 RepID=UPI003D6CA698
MRPALPNLVVIGAMKCGTTSLNDYLDLHPDVHMAPDKEINFFSGENAHRSLDWYCAQYDGTKAVRGEASQNYTKSHHPFYKGAPERMAAIIPDAKLIYLVRDPIERYRSHIVENYVGETVQEDIAWNLANDHQFQTGKYAWQLRFFLEHFRMEQILVVDSDELNRARHETMNDIFAFLGLDAIADEKAFAFKSNTNASNGVPSRWRMALPYRAARKLAPFDLDAQLSRPAISRILFPGLEKPDLSADQVDELRSRYAPEVAQLRALTGQSFAKWQV